MNHTQGEWRITNDAQGGHMIMHPTKKGYALAVLTDVFKPSNGYWYDHNWGTTMIEERQSNIRLMANSPKLYECLNQTMLIIRTFNELLSRHAKDEEIVGVLDALFDNPMFGDTLDKVEGRV